MSSRFANALAFAGLWSISAHAQALTFQDAMATATANSHEIKIIELEIQSQTYDQQRAVAGYLPKLDLSGQHLFNEKFTELELGFAGENVVIPAIAPYTSLGLTANLNIFNGFEDQNLVEAARLHILASKARLKRAEERKRIEIRTLFYRALGTQILLDVANQNIKTLQEHSEDVTSRIKSGVSTRFDSLRIEVQLEEARTEKVAAEANIAVARAKLFEGMNKPDDGSTLQGTLPADLGKISLNGVKPDTLTRSDREALTIERDQSRTMLAVSQGHWLPKVSLFGEYEFYNNYNHSIFGKDEHFKDAYALGVRMTWNLFDGGASVASERQSAIALQIAEEKIADFDSQSPASIEEAKRRFTYNTVNYSSKLTSIRKAQEAVRLARGGAKAGVRTNTEVLDAAVDLNRAKASAIKSQVDALDALGQLEMIVGHSLQ